jgi:predicted dehydrogenase
MTPDVLVVGGGMITHDQILPSLFHLQRNNVIGEISVVAQHARTVQKLAGAKIWAQAFPGQTFRRYPESGDTPQPELYRELIAKLPAQSIVIVALPDNLHFESVMTALQHDQHVLCVKPLVLTTKESHAIEEEAWKRGLLVGIEYHKRFDDRSLMARRRYRQGLFGEFRLGTASLMEKWYYRHSNFQNWCTVDNSDAFTYIGCHYVDLVHFITGLLPTSVSVYGLRDKYPNGNEGFLWTDARVLWSNGACLNVQNTLSFPDDGPGSNTQGLAMYCSSGDRGAMLRHSDQYRGIEYSYVERPDSPGATTYSEPSADYFQYVDIGGGGLTPVGYGYRSIEYIVKAALRVREAGQAEARRTILRAIDEEGVIATPANSRYNEFVTEAARLSIMNEAREAWIDYDSGAVKLR